MYNIYSLLLVQLRSFLLRSLENSHPVLCYRIMLSAQALTLHHWQASTLGIIFMWCLECFMTPLLSTFIIKVILLTLRQIKFTQPIGLCFLHKHTRCLNELSRSMLALAGVLLVSITMRTPICQTIAPTPRAGKQLTTR